MSSGEEDAAILRIVKQRSEAKRQRTLLENDLRTAGVFLQHFGESLKHIQPSPHGDPARVLQELKHAPEICGLVRLSEMLSEFVALDQTLRELDKKAKELGIE